MLTAQNKTIVRRYLEASLGNPAVFEELVVSDVVFYPLDSQTPKRGLQALKQFRLASWKRFSDLQVTIECLAAEADKVAVWYTVSGILQDESHGLPAIGNRVRISRAQFFRLEGGKIVEEREEAA
jgi:steroid delta-isomerase-like uncharacterized protein